MGHESVETTKAFYAIFEQGDLKRKHDQFSDMRWGMVTIDENPTNTSLKSRD
jgi:hypothetical protein